jgi:hypothetical protein
MTASATAPPAPHNRFSRLPRIDRVSLECHTNGEYAQKSEAVTTHFFGDFLTAIQEFYRRCRTMPLIARYRVGELPENLLKTRLN